MYHLLLFCLAVTSALSGLLFGVAFATHPLTRQPPGLSLEAAATTARGALALAFAALCVAAACAFRLFLSRGA